MRIEHTFTYIKNNRHAIDSLVKGAVLAVLLGTGVVTAQFVEPLGSPIGSDVDVLNTGGVDQTKAGELWAASIATDNPGGQLCLNNGTNCKTSWTSVHNLGTCRLETAQIISSGWMTGIDIGGQGCDMYTTPESQAAGWTSSGSNHSTVVASSDGQPPQVCVFMRLVCAPGSGVTVVPATSTVATSWPVANFTKSSNQCSDGLDNEPALGKQLIQQRPLVLRMMLSTLTMEIIWLSLIIRLLLSRFTRRLAQEILGTLSLQIHPVVFLREMGRV